MKKLFTIAAISFASMAVQAQDATVNINTSKPGVKINKEIYGQFAEHLGSCIYGGLWVGPESDIPNINGYRKDVFQALKELQIPVLRWPGGCFADEYHWMDGIGPRSERPTMSNNNWGGTVEDNSFGTHEFLNLCEMLGCEPYISANVGSGSVEEMQKWVEYMTSDGDTPMARLRRKNGRDKAWRVKYFGVGTESWGCGGNMRPEYYADLYRRYATYCRNYDGNRLYKVASGASDYDYNWTKVLMDRIGHQMAGCSLHFYTVTTWNGSKGQATLFDGEGTLKDVFIASCYALTPLPLFIIPTTLISNVLVAEEASMISLVNGIAFLWMGVLLFFGMMITHGYSIGKGFLTAAGTIVGMVFIMFIAVLFSTLVTKVISFVYNIIDEVQYRM